MATAICVPTARQAKRAGPKLEAGPEASAERSEGTMEARQGRRRRGLDAQHDSATGHVSWPGTPGLQSSMHKLIRQHREAGSTAAAGSGRSGAAGSAVFEGRQARAAGCPQGFPWRQAQRPVRGAKASRRVVRTQAGFRNRHPRRSRVQVVAPPRAYNPEGSVGW
jgi:hypothetical protein